MKLSDKEPWMAADDYGRSLAGFGVNILVRDVGEAVRFQTEVLGATVVHADPDFAVLRGFGGEWMLHADHTYSDHPLSGSLKADDPRGVGVELRLYGRDPDAAEAKARELGYVVLAGAMDKPHGLREAYLVDADGYLWVPGVPAAG
jgi:catechol 2,3-dioxygenase-like lactoylglutathione lyase family enzyme